MGTANKDGQGKSKNVRLKTTRVEAGDSPARFCRTHEDAAESQTPTLARTAYVSPEPDLSEPKGTTPQLFYSVLDVILDSAPISALRKNAWSAVEERRFSAAKR
jgi:hypothetical protein